MKKAWEIDLSGFGIVVRLTVHVSQGGKSQIRPVAGWMCSKARVSIVRWNLKKAGCVESTNSRANLRSDGQKPHIRLYMRVSLQHKMKPDSYTESWAVNTADGWRERNVWYPGKSVRNAPKEATVIVR